MPKAALNICNVGGCGRSCAAGKRFCELHEQTFIPQSKLFDKERGSASARGYGRRWQRLSKAILARDPLCQIAKLCAVGSYLPALSEVADHIIPKSKGGKDEMSNLQGACKRCHDHKTRTEDSALALREKLGRFAAHSIILLALCLASVSRTSAIPTLIQSCTDAHTTPTPLSCMLTGVGAHHLLIAAVYSCGPPVVADTFALNFSSSGVSVTNPTSCNLRQRILAIFFALTNSHSGNDTFSANTGPVTISESVVFSEWSGTLDNGCAANCSSLIDEHSAAHGTTGTAATMTAGSGFTIENSAHNPNEDGGSHESYLYFEDQVSGAAGTYDGSFVNGVNTLSSGTVTTTASGDLLAVAGVMSASSKWEIVLIAFFSDGAGPPPPGTSTARYRTQVIGFHPSVRQSLKKRDEWGRGGRISKRNRPVDRRARPRHTPAKFKFLLLAKLFYPRDLYVE